MSNKADSNKKYYQQNTPYPIRLGDLKTQLQKEAFELNTSIHDRIIHIIDGYYHKREVLIDVSIQKLIEMSQSQKKRERRKCCIAQLRLFSES